MLRFGTDGIRGRANQELTMDVGYWFGVAVAEEMECDRVAIGRDTRESGFWLAQAVGLGLAASGVDVIDCGIMPTGALSWVARKVEAPTVVVSASHNPYYDNGIKVFTASGGKLSERMERKIEGTLNALVSGRGKRYGKLGGYEPRDFSGEYVAWLLSLRGPLERTLLVAYDAANGAAAGLADGLIESLGAEVALAIGNGPDGHNINDGVGALHPERLVEAVVASGADVGLAFDGDADRLIAVSPSGRVVDGDDIMALLALDLHRRGGLAGPGIVVTVMSNLGLEKAMVSHGFEVVRTRVGDRQVAIGLEETGFGLGGEQSGHIIVPSLSPTGDGLLTALLLLHIIAGGKGNFDALLDRLGPKYPQIHRQVPTASCATVAAAPEVSGLVEEVEAQLGDQGRVVLRASGTEPLVRIMVEARSVAEAETAADRLVGAVLKAAGRI